MIRTITLFLFSVILNLLFAQQYTLPDFFTVQRNTPLIILPTTQSINVRNYGAIPNDGLDDLTAIKNAIKAANAISTQSTPIKVVFETGVYDLFPTTNHAFESKPGAAGSDVELRDIDYLVLEGNNCELLNHNPKSHMFSMYRWNYVIFQDIVIDYAVLPFSQGVVKSVNFTTGEFLLELSEGMPQLNDGRFVASDYNSYTIKHKDGSGRTKPFTNGWWPTMTYSKVAGTTNQYLCKAGSSDVASTIEVGDYIVYNARVNSGATFWNEQCGNITYLRTTVYTAPAGVFGGWDNYEINIIESKVIPRAERVHSAVADAMHYSGNYRGIWVEGCHFSGYNDDTANIKHSMRETTVSGPTTVSFSNEVNAGEIIKFYDVTNGIIYGTCKTKNGGTSNIQLETPHNIPSSHGRIVGYLVTRSSQGMVIRNNVFENARGCGIVLQCTEAEISNNIYRYMSVTGIKFDNIAYWMDGPEGFAAAHIRIEGNQFYHCGTDREFYSGEAVGAITSRVIDINKNVISTQAIEDITIRNNYFEFDRKAVYLRNINCLTFENNDFVYKPLGFLAGDVIPVTIQNTTYCNQPTVMGVKLYPEAYRLTQPNQTYQLQPTFIPSDLSSPVTWSSSDSNVASVDVNGLVIAKGEGVAEITVTTQEGFTDTMTITVAYANTDRAIIHFPFDEAVGAKNIVNIGTAENVTGNFYEPTTGLFTPGFTDPDKGQVLYSNTSANGHIILYERNIPWKGPENGDAYTYSFWMKPKGALQSYNDIIFHGNGQTTGTLRLTANAQGKLSLLFASNTMSTVGTYKDEVWTHVALTMPKNGLFKDAQFYINGEPVAQEYNSTANPAITVSRVLFQISSSLKGYLSDWRYYNYKLSPEEIKNIESPIALQSISILPSSTVLKPLETKQLNPLFTPTNATNRIVTWSSNNTNIATVNINGLVTAVANGTAVITVKNEDGTLEGYCNITVDSNMTSVTSVTVNPTTLALNPGNTAHINHTVYPNNATDSSVYWSSENANIATVDQNGNVTAVANGTVNIIVTTSNGGKTATTQVQVTTPVTGVSLPPSLTLSINGSQLIVPIFQPTTASNTGVSWLSNNPSVANIDNNGLVTAYASGQATISVKTNDGNFTATMTVYVGKRVTSITISPKLASISLSQTVSITPNVLPLDAINRAITWSSDNNNIATVDANGNVKGVGVGFTTIRATTQDGGFVDSCFVAVNNIAYNKPVTVSSGDWTSNNTKAKLNDLNLTTSWEGFSFAAGQATIDLGTDYDITQFALFPKASKAYMYTIAVKPDAGTNFTTVVDRSGNSTYQEVTLDNVYAIGRYVKLTLIGVSGNQFDNTFYINEFMVFGGPKGTLSSSESIDLDKNISVFPNPSKGFLNISCNSISPNREAHIIDLSGRVILKNQIKALESYIDLSHLSNGMYLLYIKDGNQLMHQQKIILNK